MVGAIGRAKYDAEEMAGGSKFNICYLKSRICKIWISVETLP